MSVSQDQFYDPLETRPSAERDAATAEALPGLLRHAVTHAPGLASHLSGVVPEEITSLEALASAPVLRKSDLPELQRARPPLGGLTAVPLERLAKLYMSPGPIFEVEGNTDDYWRMARAFHAAGFRAGDLIHNTFALHLTPAGSMMEGGARTLGCPVIPAGTGNTERQVRMIHQLRPNAYVGTPSFLKILLERGQDDGLDLSSLAKAMVSGEAFPRALAEEMGERFGIVAYQCYASADLGLIAYETSAREGLVVDESVLVEIVRPGTGVPVQAGEVGEVVVTTFNPIYPLIRFATGDLSAILPGTSPCGRTNQRLAGWLGRADQTTKVKSMFVHPRQIAEVVGRHGEITRARLVVEREAHLDRMTLHCEASVAGDDLEASIAATLLSVTGLHGEVRLVGVGTLANDGLVIEDRRAPA